MFSYCVNLSFQESAQGILTSFIHFNNCEDGNPLTSKRISISEDRVKLIKDDPTRCLCRPRLHDWNLLDIWNPVLKETEEHH